MSVPAKQHCTAASAGAAATECCGRGTGLDDEGLEHKVTTVAVACGHHAAALAHQASEAGDGGKVEVRTPVTLHITYHLVRPLTPSTTTG